MRLGMQRTKLEKGVFFLLLTFIKSYCIITIVQQYKKDLQKEL